MSRHYIERVVVGEERGPLSWLIRAALWPLSVIYRLGLAAYLGLYGIGIRKRHRLRMPVISVGNLTFGGTGKTPAVQELCRILLEQGRSVAILSRGHGGSAKGCVVVSDGQNVLVDPVVAGDEPVLLARTLPGVPVIVGKDRRESGELAFERFSPDVVVLDDGLQYWQLHRDLDIVVLDAARPAGSGFVMPMGDLREPAGGIMRAGVVLVNEPAGGATRGQLRPLPSEALVLRARRIPASLRGADGTELECRWLSGRRIIAFCGIGNPDSFRRMLCSLGAVVDAFMEYADHHAYTPDDLNAIEAARATLGAEAVVTTEKDWVRLGETPPIRDLYVLDIKLEIEDRERLGQYISQRIDRAREEAAAKKTAH